MHRSIRASAAALATGLVLVACGTASDSAPDTASGAAPATEPATAPVTDVGAADQTDVAAEAPIEANPAPAGDEPAADITTTSNLPPAAEVPATEAPATTPAEAAPGGRAFASELAADSDFAENLLPDLLVDDIRSGQKVNIRNVFPAERPVLMWMWAPH